MIYVRISILLTAVAVFAACVNAGGEHVNKQHRNQNIYNPSRFIEFYTEELRTLSGDNPQLAVQSIYTISRNQSPDIAVFLGKLWDRQPVRGVAVNYSLFEHEKVKLMLAQTILERKQVRDELVDFIYSTVDFDDIDNQHFTIQALRVFNHEKSLAYLREYSIRGNRRTAEYAISGIIHWAFFGDNKEQARYELEIIRQKSPHQELIKKYEQGYKSNFDLK